jgi:pectinesterase
MADHTNTKITLILRLTILAAIVLFTANCSVSRKAASRPIIVDINGKGDFVSIQAAINSLSDTASQPRIIEIRPGVYREKIFIAKHQLILSGIDREKTIITQDIARDEWRCDHPDDWGVATVNLNANDITLRNLTIANDYGFNNSEPRIISCSSDSTGKRTITKNGHQMALRTMNATRMRAINCIFRAWAGDTVSPWNVSEGMFYFRDCVMQGGVDFYCPRGWAFAENCSFYANTGPASIWHDGSVHEDSKTVLINCSFDGYEGFKLGRYHRDAQFYLLHCNFSKNMADADIYLVPTANTIRWGKRVYYFDCHRDGGDYVWMKNNLSEAKGSPASSQINTKWLFGNKWNPTENW